MKVILLERVEGKGGLGDVDTVKDGYARNFLLPRSKALRANAANLKVFEAQRSEIEARNAKAKDSAGSAGEKLDGTSYVMIRQAGESGQLYGSVAGRDVADAINAEGSSKVDRAMVEIVQRNSDGVLVRGEVAPGDMVVTQGVLQLTPGLAVRLLED